MITHWTILLAVEAVEKKGGLFDFDATLPVMAAQIVILALLLNAVFYKPIGKALDDRDEYIRSNLVGAKEQLAESQRLATQYEQDLANTRRESQAIIATAQQEAQALANAQIAQAQQEAVKQREQAQAEIAAQKEAAFASLTGDVDALSRQILEKILGPELVK